MPKALLKQVTIHYQQRGEKGRHVILIHGMAGNMSFWFMRILPALAQKYQVTAYDLKGHGCSSQPDSGYTTDEMAEDLKGLMDYLNIDCAILIAHSFGCAIALHFTALYPQRVLAIVALDANVPALWHLSRFINKKGWEVFVDSLTRLGIPLEKNMVSHKSDSEEDSYMPIQTGLYSIFRKQMSRLTQLAENTAALREMLLVNTLTEEVLSHIDCHILGAYGSLSPYYGIGERLKEIMPHCDLVVMPGYGHFYPMQAPDIALELINNFLNQLNL